MINSEQLQPESLQSNVLRVSDVSYCMLARLVQRFAMQLELIDDTATIPGSFWGDEEAGLVGNRLIVRSDTPIHSVLHELCHFVCMSPERRQNLFKDAKSGPIEENAVCYLQILLADFVEGFGRARALQDMDAWGYSFRLGSAQQWFEQDAEEAEAFLQEKGIISDSGQVLFCLNQQPDKASAQH